MSPFNPSQCRLLPWSFLSTSPLMPTASPTSLTVFNAQWCTAHRLELHLVAPGSAAASTVSNLVAVGSKRISSRHPIHVCPPLPCSVQHQQALRALSIQSHNCLCPLALPSLRRPLQASVREYETFVTRCAVLQESQKHKYIPYVVRCDCKSEPPIGRSVICEHDIIQSGAVCGRCPW